MTEEWRPIVGYEGLYEVSSAGRVRSLPRPRAGRAGSVNVHKGKMLNQQVGTNGYITVGLVDADHHRKVVSIHRLVAQAFLPNPDGLPVVRHLDDVSTNNVLSNLAWGTYSDNSYDSVRNGNNPNANKTHCPQGHPYDELNTVITNTGGRRCGKCQHEALRRRKDNRRKLARERIATETSMAH